MMVRTISNLFSIKKTYDTIIVDELYTQTSVDDSAKALAEWLIINTGFTRPQLADEELKAKIIACTQYISKHCKTKDAKKLAIIQKIQDNLPRLRLHYFPGSSINTQIVDKNILSIKLQ